VKFLDVRISQCSVAT